MFWSPSELKLFTSTTRVLLPAMLLSSFESTPDPTPTANILMPARLTSRALARAFDLSPDADCPSVSRTQTLGASERSPRFDWKTVLRTISRPPAMSVVCMLRPTSFSSACKSCRLSCARRSKCILGLSPNVTTLTRTQSRPVVRSATKRLMKALIFAQLSAVTLADESIRKARSVFLQAAETGEDGREIRQHG